MPQSPATPKVSFSFDLQSIQELIASVEKSTESNQRLNIDIYVGPAPVASGPNIPSGPHEVNRGAWAILPPEKSGASARAAAPASAQNEAPLPPSNA